MRGGPDEEGDLNNNQTRELLCDDYCLTLERNRKFAEALGIIPPTAVSPFYFSDILIHLGRASPNLIMRLEKTFDDFIKNPNSHKYSFPPMDRLQRQIIHELCKPYNLDSESMDREPYRNVIVTKRRDSKTPPVLLSTIIQEEILKQQQQQQQQQNNNSNMNSSSSSSSSSGNNPSRPSSILIYDLNPDVKTHHLMTLLQTFENQFTLKWIDDFSALAIFNNYNVMRSALYYLTGGPFKVMEYRESATTRSTSLSDTSSTGTTTSSDGGTATKEKKKREYQPAKESWRDDNNYFAALEEANRNNNNNSNSNNIPGSTINYAKVAVAPPRNNNSKSDEMWGGDEESTKFEREEQAFQSLNDLKQEIKQISNTTSQPATTSTTSTSTIPLNTSTEEEDWEKGN